MIYNVDPQLSQWNVGRSIKVGDTNATHILFANQGDSKGPKIEIVDGEAKIPDYLLQTGKTLLVYLILNGVTLESRSFPVAKQPRPEDYVYEEDQRNYIYELITNAENATNEANTAAENAKVATARATVATENANVATNNANLAADSANKAAVQAAHTAKSLMVVGNAKGEIIALNDAIEQFFVGYKIFGKTTQDGIPTPDAPVEIVSSGDGGSISVTVAGKNLLQNEANSQTINGLTVTVNPDKSIKFNGTAEKQTTVLLKAGRGWINGGGYVGTGCPNGGGATKYYIRFGDSIKSYDDYGSGVTASFAEDSHCYAQITIMSGITANNLTFYPMLRYSHALDSTYEPYREVSVLTISTPNGLPGIPVKSGGNYTDANGQQWICDDIDLARGVYVQRVKQVVLKGTESFSASWTEFNSCVAFNYSALDKLYTDPTTWADVMCNILPRITGPNYTNTDNVFGVGGLAGSITFKILKTDIGTSAKTNAEALGDWRSYLAEKYAAGMPVVFVYAIKPIETPLSEEELAAYASLHTYRGNTTVFNDAGAYMELEYVMDAKKYIDSKIASAILPATVE